jgi:hypothetical protein
MWLKAAISWCKYTFKCHCSGVAGWNALLGHHSWFAFGLGTRFYVKVFMEFVLQNTVALTIVYTFIVLYNKHRLVPFVSPFSYSCLCLTCCSRLCKVCIVLMIVFYKFYYIECVFFFICVCVCVCGCVWVCVCMCVWIFITLNWYFCYSFFKWHILYIKICSQFLGSKKWFCYSNTSLLRSSLEEHFII